VREKPSTLSRTGSPPSSPSSSAFRCNGSWSGTLARVPLDAGGTGGGRAERERTGTCPVRPMKKRVRRKDSQGAARAGPARPAPRAPAAASQCRGPLDHTAKAKAWLANRTPARRPPSSNHIGPAGNADLGMNVGLGQTQSTDLRGDLSRPKSPSKVPSARHPDDSGTHQGRSVAAAHRKALGTRSGS